jgi:hypothetical protein
VPDGNLPQFATPLEMEAFEAASLTKTLKDAAKHAGITLDVLNKRLRRLEKRAARSGYAPKHGLLKALPEGLHLRGATIQTDGAGKVERVWAKAWEDKDSALGALLEAVERAGESCVGISRVSPAPKHTRQDLLALYGAGDPHFGMHAWHRVAGADWDLHIAEATLTHAVQMLTGAAPEAAEAIFLNAGDMFHADDNKARTPASGNALDVDGRWSKVLDVVLRTHLVIAKTLLAKHDTVRFIALPGNHDPQSTLVLQTCLRLMFKDEPRITIDADRHLYTHYEFGSGMLGFHHGHGAKPAQLPLLMATKWPKEWAATTERRIYTGHLHNEIVREYAGATVETLPTLACADQWADAAGYISQRSMLCDTWHRDLGRVQRNLTNIRHLAQ